jgi:hypothetical protein
MTEPLIEVEDVLPTSKPADVVSNVAAKIFAAAEEDGGGMVGRHAEQGHRQQSPSRRNIAGWLLPAACSLSTLIGSLSPCRTK